MQFCHTQHWNTVGNLCEELGATKRFITVGEEQIVNRVRLFGNANGRDWLGGDHLFDHVHSYSAFCQSFLTDDSE